MYRIYPKIKKMSFTNNGEFFLPDRFIIFFNSKMVSVCNKLSSNYNCEIGKEADANILFLLDVSLGEEAYRIKIDNNKIIVYYHYESGAFYAVITLLQIINQVKQSIKTVIIEDEPDLKVRGFMLDISRDKVPQITTVKKVIDMMSNIKMNHLELYVEGFSYGYPSFEEYLEKDGFISVEEYQEIEKYAQQNFIDLVPNQNGFGHMAKWLALDEFKDLAEQPEGIFLWGRHREPNTLNPLDEGSLELIKRMYQDMLAFSNSKYFNMNFDEPFELGKGKSKQACDEQGIGNVYIDYVLKVYKEIKKYNKIPLIWGDVLIKHPELLYRLPKDMIFLDWGYDANYPFSKNLKKLADLGINFMAAPGTTSWCSFAGRTHDWLENITNACVYTKLYGGLGILLTDWGDFGHLQFLPVSYPPLIFAGLFSWRVSEGTFLTIRDYLNTQIFKDENNIIADTIIDLGNYYRYLNDYRSNGTTTFHNFMWATYAVNEEEPCKYYRERTTSILLDYNKYKMLDEFLILKEKEIELSQLNVDDGDVIKEELQQTISLLKNIHKLNIAHNERIDINLRIELLEEVLANKSAFIEKQKELWLSRNKQGGIKDSLSYLERFYQFIEITLKDIRGVINEA